MPRFLQEADYDGRIKAEIKKVVTGTTGADPSAMQLQAEETAIEQVTQTIGGRYDCSQLFVNQDSPYYRNAWIIKCVVTLTLFELYHQTGWNDIPEHRKTEYDTVISWLTRVGDGRTPATFPKLADDTNPGEVRYNTRTPQRGRW